MYIYILKKIGNFAQKGKDVCLRKCTLPDITSDVACFVLFYLELVLCPCAMQGGWWGGYVNRRDSQSGWGN